MKYLKSSLMIASLFFHACGVQHRDAGIDVSNLKEAWDANNDPRLLRDRYEVRFASLPLRAELKRKPWTDTYWPSYLGGVANRWNDESGSDSFAYPLLKREELAAMSLENLKKLSPAEKYDIYVGRTDYPFVNAERSRTNANQPKWYGLCHGWAPASLNFNEPHPIVVESRSGLKIPFGSSDIKALLTYIQQSGRDSRMVGRRCESDPSHSNDPACKDINAGSFHVILANQIGIVKAGFVAEIARGSEVWNQPVFGFASTKMGESNQPNRNAAPGTTKIVTIETTMRFIGEIGANWDPRPFDEFPSQESDRKFSYNLELNARGEIIGGEWLTEDRPDFLWTQQRPVFSGYFKAVEGLYQISTK